MHSTSNLIDQTSPYISGYNQYGLPVFPFIATTKTKLKGTVYLHTLSSFMSAYLYGTVDPQLVGIPWVSNTWSIMNTCLIANSGHISTP